MIKDHTVTALTPACMPVILWLNKADLSDSSQLGGKGFSLAHMIQHLGSRGIEVPNGFVLTSEGVNRFLEYNQLKPAIASHLAEIDTDDLVQLREGGKLIRDLITDAEITGTDIQVIIKAYAQLSIQYGCYGVDVGVRSSAIGEDGANHSWAGQLDSFLNIQGEKALLLAIKQCVASLYTDRLIVYRKTIKDGSADQIRMAVVIQKMVRADRGASGVAFSLDTESGFRDTIVINGAPGLGEMVVQGSVEPDEFIIHKPTLRLAYDSIIDKKLGRKDAKMIYDPNGGTCIIPVTDAEKGSFCLSDTDILKLGKWVDAIEAYYTELHNTPTPVDVEWALESVAGSTRLFIVQARAETVHSRTRANTVCEFKLTEGNHTTLLEGIAVGDRIGTGRVRIIESIDSEAAKSFERGDVLVVDQTTPDWEPLMIKSSAIVCNKGGRTCHAAIIARECGITAVVGTRIGSKTLVEGSIVTVSCAEGDVGRIYEGPIPFTETHTDLATLPTINTKIMLNIANPHEVFKYSSYPAQGVGLVREEFIINNYIQAHPNALINYDKLTDMTLKLKLDQLMVGYTDPLEYYVSKLSFGLARIAAAFYPKDVIVRFSDFKSNEYGSLLGGQYYEAFNEQNPMIGFRGASRYYDPLFREAFGLECKAIKRIREVMGLTNVIVMIPFCRTPEECTRVQEVMKENGLERGVRGLQVYIMCEIPSNVVLAEEFCEQVDGFSIGSNDLTQLVLGLDRDSELITHLYNEQHPAVKKTIVRAITACKSCSTKIGICGQGPSDYPEFAQFLVENGIDSISVTPDALFRTINVISAVEAAASLP
ncbi:Phosphoenolpyruvate synthase [uncultured virus]|nr:Phosphoenolpyruvate synthase [uncultured virus]